MRCPLLTALVAVATLTSAAAAERTRLSLPLTRYVLANGMTVILHEDHHLPTVVVELGFRVGSKDERVGRTGFAHLFEHLMFMGTARVPNGEFDSVMEAAGGQNNASTSTDRTAYVDMGPANLLETLFWLESDRFSTLPSAMTKKKLELQRDVVENERREIENRPYGRGELMESELLYPVGHPYHHPVIGSHEDLHSARVGDVNAFFHQYYVPANATLIVSGDFSTAETRRLVDKYFAWMPKAPIPPHTTPPPAKLTHPVRLTIHDDVKLPRLMLAWLSPADYAPGDAECDLLAALLGAGKSSRLYRALVYDRKLASSVEVVQESAQFGSQLTIAATAAPGHTTAELERALDEELARITSSAPPTASELERARSSVQIDSLREISEPTRLAEQLLLFELRFNDPSQLQERLMARYDDVTLDDEQRWAKTVLSAPRLTLAIEPGASGSENVGGAK